MPHQKTVKIVYPHSTQTLKMDVKIALYKFLIVKFVMKRVFATNVKKDLFKKIIIVLNFKYALKELINFIITLHSKFNV